MTTDLGSKNGYPRPMAHQFLICSYLCQTIGVESSYVTFKMTHYPFFNGLAFLALYVVIYGGNAFMKPDD
jgi:hypothetical protein